MVFSRVIVPTLFEEKRPPLSYWVARPCKPRLTRSPSGKAAASRSKAEMRWIVRAAVGLAQGRLVM